MSYDTDECFFMCSYCTKSFPLDYMYRDSGVCLDCMDSELIRKEVNGGGRYECN